MTVAQNNLNYVNKGLGRMLHIADLEILLSMRDRPFTGVRFKGF